MPTTTKPEALITTPDIDSWCEDCRRNGTRHPGDEIGRTFPHCPECGSTDLVDTRTPFQVLHEAIANAAAPDLDVETRWGRLDVVDRVRPFAAAMARNHCSGCITWSARVAVRD